MNTLMEQCLENILAIADAQIAMLTSKIEVLRELLRNEESRRRELEDACKALADAAVAAKIMAKRIRQCPATQGAGGQTIDACIARTVYVRVPASLLSDFEDKWAATHDSPIVRDIVEAL